MKGREMFWIYKTEFYFKKWKKIYYFGFRHLFFLSILQIELLSQMLASLQQLKSYFRSLLN